MGCWPCIFSRKAEVRLVADKDPARIDRLERLETEVQAAAAKRHAAKGEETHSPPTFFHDRNKRQRTPWPIRKVVKWSRTARGGKRPRNLELFEDREGCMRWGLCDTGGDDAS